MLVLTTASEMQTHGESLTIGGMGGLRLAKKVWAEYTVSWQRVGISYMPEGKPLKTQREKLSELAASSATMAGRGVASAQRAAVSVGMAAVSAGQFANNVTHDIVDHPSTKAALQRVKDLAASAKVEAGEIASSAADRAMDLAATTAQGARKLSNHVVATAKKVDENHQQVAAKTDTVSMGLGIAAGVVVAGAKLTAIPLVVAASPAIGGAATVVGVVAGSAHFYSKWKTKKAAEKDVGAVQTTGDDPAHGPQR